MTEAEELARFVAGSAQEGLSGEAKQALKVRVLDSIGCALGALGAEPIEMLRSHLKDFGGSAHSTLIGGGTAPPDQAALYNGALVRYLDFNDSYLAPGETCHPSDNLAPVLAAAEYAHASGRDLLLALAVAYQVQCRLSDAAPVRQKGFDHTTQGSYAVAAGVARALKLDALRTAHAIAISGTAFNALRVTRTGRLSHWKGLAYPNTAFCATHAAFLAMRGITGPLEVFEGNKGFKEAIAGDFRIDWAKEDLERVNHTILKKYNAEIHSQSAVEALLDLQADAPFTADDVEAVEVEIFDVAYNIIGGGEEGEKADVRTKEEADHSLPYILAVALLDSRVMPDQYRQERILRQDVQQLLRRVTVRPREDYGRRFPAEMPCRISVHLKGGRVLENEKRDYEGFSTRPLPWEPVVEKFRRLSAGSADGALQDEIVAAVANLDSIEVGDLTQLLDRVHSPTRRDD